jgi:hypothetical protein
MLNARELATILAALLFWREEIATANKDVSQNYFQSVRMGGVEPLTIDEIKQLSRRLRKLRRSD